MADSKLRLDYSRIWSRLTRRELDYRISTALRQLAGGKTLAQVARQWNLKAPSLCRVLLAHAPQEWVRAQTAAHWTRLERANNKSTRDPRNAMARAQVWSRRGQLHYMLRRLAKAELDEMGNQLVGPCPACHEPRGSYASTSGAKCYNCGWEGDAQAYLLSLIPNPLKDNAAAPQQE